MRRGFCAPLNVLPLTSAERHPTCLSLGRTRQFKIVFVIFKNAEVFSDDLQLYADQLEGPCELCRGFVIHLLFRGCSVCRLLVRLDVHGADPIANEKSLAD